MGIWIELGIFVLALAFGLWQIHDVKKARKQTLQQRALERQREEALLGEKTVAGRAREAGASVAGTSDADRDSASTFSDRR